MTAASFNWNEARKTFSQPDGLLLGGVGHPVADIHQLTKRHFLRVTSASGLRHCVTLGLDRIGLSPVVPFPVPVPVSLLLLFLLLLLLLLLAVIWRHLVKNVRKKLNQLFWMKWLKEELSLSKTLLRQRRSHYNELFWDYRYNFGLPYLYSSRGDTRRYQFVILWFATRT